MRGQAITKEEMDRRLRSDGTDNLILELLTNLHNSRPTMDRLEQWAEEHPDRWGQMYANFLRISKHVQPQGGNVNIFISNEWKIVQGVILESLAAYPEAQRAVLDGLAKAQAEIGGTDGQIIDQEGAQPLQEENLIPFQPKED